MLGPVASAAAETAATSCSAAILALEKLGAGQSALSSPIELNGSAHGPWRAAGPDDHDEQGAGAVVRPARRARWIGLYGRPGNGSWRCCAPPDMAKKEKSTSHLDVEEGFRTLREPCPQLLTMSGFSSMPVTGCRTLQGFHGRVEGDERLFPPLALQPRWCRAPRHQGTRSPDESPEG